MSNALNILTDKSYSIGYGQRGGTAYNNGYGQGSASANGGTYSSGQRGSSANSGGVSSWYDYNNSNSQNGTTTYNSYAGADIKVTMSMPGISPPLTFGNLRTISVSSRRQVVPVPIIGSTNIRGFTRGHRIIAGSLIFASFNTYTFHLIEGLKNMPAGGKVLADMLPPFDVTITQINEYGDMSSMVVRGVTIVDEGIVFSTDDIFSEQTHTFVARELIPVSTDYIGIT